MAVNKNRSLEEQIASNYFAPLTTRTQDVFRLDSPCENTTKFLQYYCSNFDEKMRYFEVKDGNKK
jgi:hypothetical protein